MMQSAQAAGELVRHAAASGSSGTSLLSTVRAFVNKCRCAQLTAVSGSQHSEMARACIELAESYLSRGLAQQALMHAQRSRDISNSVRDADCRALHPTVLLTLGICMTLLERYADAHTHLRRALRAAEGVHGPDSVQLTPVYMALAKLSVCERDLGQGLEWLQAVRSLIVFIL